MAQSTDEPHDRPRGKPSVCRPGCNYRLSDNGITGTLAGILSEGSQMRQKVLIFSASFVVALICLLFATVVFEATTSMGKAPTEHASGNSLPAVTGPPATYTGASKAAYGTGGRLEARGWLSGIVPAVVRIFTNSGAGSGVVIEPIGVVLTSAHVVGDDTHVKVLVEDSKRLTGTVYRIDTTRDLALVRLPPGDYRSASLGQGSDVILGAPVTAIGYPLNLAGPATVTAGIVSRILYQPEFQREVIQTDAAINVGNSGGPLLDANGQVIGIIVSVLREYQSRPTSGISHAVSVSSITDDFLGSTLTQ